MSQTDLPSLKSVYAQSAGRIRTAHKSGRTLKTMEDLEKIFYPWMDPTSPFYGLKADDPTLTSSSNVLTTTYGKILWDQINMEYNTFGILPKRPWDRRGWRMISARGTAGGGIAENAALPDTDQPTIAVASAAPKTIAHNFDVSYQLLLEAEGEDDIIGDPLSTYREKRALEHSKAMNEHLMTDFDTLAGNNLESLDRLCATNSEQSGVGATTGDEDIFGIDKSANSWADPYSDHNSGTDRTLTISMLNNLIRTTQPYWSDPTGRNCVLLTGHDTADEIAELLQPQQRFVDVYLNNGIQRNSVSTREGGVEGGFSVLTYKTLPIFETIDAPQDTISRIYLLDLGHTFLKMLAPTQYFETNDPFALNKLNHEGMYVTIGELNCMVFKANGKIRDLQ